MVGMVGNEAATGRARRDVTRRDNNRAALITTAGICVEETESDDYRHGDSRRLRRRKGQAAVAVSGRSAVGQAVVAL
jgi:hypothetical protein